MSSEHGSRLFGDPKIINAATESAIFEARSLQQEIDKYRTILGELQPPISEAYVQSTLFQVENSVKSISRELSLIKRAEAAVDVAKARSLAFALEDTLTQLRERFPSDGPIRIDNGALFVQFRVSRLSEELEHAFANPARGRSAPALIAYTLALVQRVFLGAGHRAAGFTLRMLSLFGDSLTALAGGPNQAQKEAMAQVPRTIETVERRFNLDVLTTPYAICPSCSFTHKPTYPNGPEAEPAYPEICGYQNASFRGPCTTSLLQFGRPIKTLLYCSFFEWFGRLLALPGIEEYGDKFCGEISDAPETPTDKFRPSDGRFYRELRDGNGNLFVLDRGGQGRWILSLHADFFNIEGNIIGGQHSSTGVMSVTVLNFPPAMRDDVGFTFIPGLIPGFYEPDSKEAEHQHYLKPFVDELVAGYEHGVCYYGSHSSSTNLDEHVPYSRVHKFALGPVVMDFKAARPFAGLSDIGSRLYCIYCKVWHRFYRLRTDFEAWVRNDDTRLREGAQKWKSAHSQNERESILHRYGTRFSELWRLPYFSPTKQLVVDPMHAWYLVILQRFFRGKHALGLENPHKRANKPSDDADEAAYTAAEIAVADETSPIAFRHDFAFPPDLALVGSNPDTPLPDILPSDDHEDQLQTLGWTHLSENRNSLRSMRIEWMKPILAANANGIANDVGAIHLILSEASPSLPEYEEFERRLVKHRWIPLLYVCNDIMEFPADKYISFAAQPVIPERAVTKAELAAALRSWVGFYLCFLLTRRSNLISQRTSKIMDQESFSWPHFTPMSIPAPEAPWARHVPSAITSLHRFNDTERALLHENLVTRMSYNSARHIGDIHRLLCAPLNDNSERGLKTLAVQLAKINVDALKYVCIDLNCLPREKLTKSVLVQALIDWVCSFH